MVILVIILWITICAPNIYMHNFFKKRNHEYSMGVKYAPNMHIIFFLLKNYIYIYKEKHKQKKVSFNLRNF
jgi:hypothetical protein